jgi:hypothetical protein
MFGTNAFYLGEKIVACFTKEGDEPMNGILWPVEWEAHARLTADYPALAPHPLLTKWLYLSSNDETFDATARALIARILRNDPLLGVIPKPRRKSKGIRSKASERKGKK